MTGSAVEIQIIMGGNVGIRDESVSIGLSAHEVFGLEGLCVLAWTFFLFVWFNFDWHLFWPLRLELVDKITVGSDLGLGLGLLSPIHSFFVTYLL